MKKFKARKEREQQETIVRPRAAITDPSDELFSQSPPWQQDDPLQDSFLEQHEVLQEARDYNRVPRLKIRSVPNTSPGYQRSMSAQRDGSQDQDSQHWSYNYEDNLSSSARASAPISIPATYYDVSPESIARSLPTHSYLEDPPFVPQRHPHHTHPVSTRSRARSTPPSRDLYQSSVSPLKTDFQAFSQRCAPSPTSPSLIGATPMFELSADEASYTLANIAASLTPVELEGSPVESSPLYPSPLNIHNKQDSESEPEASPYNRFTAFSKSIHALSANLSPIEETEEEAASRRSSTALVYELPAIVPRNSISPSAYSGGTSITPRASRSTIHSISELASIPARTTSTRSSQSTISTNSVHSMFSFEYSNSDTEKIYVSATPIERRKSSAPSLSDVSSVDDFDFDIELDFETKRSKSISKRDAKLERFFGIRQYSLNSESGSDSSLTIESPTTPADTFDNRRSSMPAFQASYGLNHTAISIDDLDLSLALENDPYKREIMSMHKSILSKSQSKQDAKLEKFFGCDKDQIQVARNSSTGSRLAGCTDDLKYRSIGW